ncbi:DUF1543 domain-containing protein [Neokomagataea tanensis]|uniref:DUF1543 domain-containing protein n=2 Tax=Neokomagataea TaxID=1223423 RepID=A0A4Y6VB91_9PROT|nr:MULTISPECIES: DUF1543 domain-containing protein [Neokomagataea]QDH25786.1 DUF1543 domain-containing protein [Neokomagataea tanensis]
MTSDKNLFVFYLGGEAPKANIEVHDVQFAIAKNAKDAYPPLIERWFGTRASLHIDAYGVLKWADGYAISVRPTPSASKQKLYFINMGGYLPGALTEEHAFTFLVAASPEVAKARARKMLLTGHDHQHRDNLMEVDDCVLLDTIDGHFIHLEPSSDGTPIKAEWQGYQPI